MSFFDDEVTHLSQLANDPLNPAAPRPAANALLDFRGAFGPQLQGQPSAQAANGAANGAPGTLAAVVATSVGDGKPRQQLRPARQGKLFNDPIHGSFRLDPTVVEVIDGRHFQRLRRLKQLGLAYQVFPGASHNRFEHSLGVAHLAYKLGHHLWSMQRGELDMDRRDLLVVELAGACHDLGHGPFSHVFDRELLRAKGITNWEHEDMSGRMLDAILDEKCIDTLREDDRKRVQAMITAAHVSGGAGDGKRWLTEIVANGRNSIDVDKFDYLLRDSQYCGVKISFDLSRVMQFTKVMGDEICFKYSEYMNLHELFHSRASMHRQVYTHRKAKAIEFMVVDALLEADAVLRLTDKIWDVNAFAQLDDGVLELVEGCGRGGLLGPLLQLDPDQEQALAAAQAVIARLRRRDLYKFCSEALVPQEMVDRCQWKMPSESEVVAHYSGSDVRLRPQDIILTEVKIDHSLGTKNPLDHTSFFDDFYSTTTRQLKPYQITGMVPACFQEKTIRVYSRNSSPAYVAGVHAAFESWTRTRFGTSFKGSSTPLKLPTHHAPAPPPGLGVGLAAEIAGSAAALAGEGAVGGKRGRALFVPPGGPEDDPSPTNLLRTKQRRQVEQRGS